MTINKKVFIQRRIIIVSIALLVAALHIIRIGSFLPDEYFKLYSSYFSDIFLPFVFYFLLCAAEFKIPLMKHWYVKLSIAFLLPSIDETLQLFGISILGFTFDPVDYLMYGIGSTAACIAETQLFPIVFKFWKKENSTLNVSMMQLKQP